MGLSHVACCIWDWVGFLTMGHGAYEWVMSHKERSRVKARVMEHMNEWISHVTFTWHDSSKHTNGSWGIWISHVTFIWHDSSKHTNGSWGIWISTVIFICESWHGAKNGVGGHMNESRGIWMSKIIFILHMWHMDVVCTPLRGGCTVCVTHEWVMAYAICDVWMIYVHSLVMRAMYVTHMNKLCTQGIQIVSHESCIWMKLIYVHSILMCVNHTLHTWVCCVHKSMHLDELCHMWQRNNVCAQLIHACNVCDTHKWVTWYVAYEWFMYTAYSCVQCEWHT